MRGTLYFIGMSDQSRAATVPAHAGAETRAALLEKLTPGIVVADKYRLEGTLGRGAMGVVVAAQHMSLGERVALKFLLLDDESHQLRSRFAREARVCAKLRNEHVVRVTDFGTWRESLAFMVMECLEGSDLRAMLREHGGKLPVDVAVDFAVQACDGLADVHAKGIIHRDLKPSNLFVTTREDGSKLLKILDFGISKWSDGQNLSLESELTETGMLLGTPKFMSPEQLFGSHELDARTDVWSIGAIVYEMLTGQAPFEENTFAKLCARLARGEAPGPPSALRPELPAAIDQAVLAALEINADARTTNVAELAGDLLAAIGAANAEQVRARLSATLAASASSVRIRSAPKSDASGSHPGIAPVPAEVAPARASSNRWWAIAVAIVAGATIIAFSRRNEPTPVSASPAPVVASAPSIASTSSVAAIASPLPSPSGTAAAPTKAPGLALAPPKSVTVTAKPTEVAPAPSTNQSPSLAPSSTKKPGLDGLLEDRQ